jgi:transposase-like protein
VSEVARRHGIARRVLFRWRREEASPVFIDVEIVDEPADEVSAP